MAAPMWQMRFSAVLRPAWSKPRACRTLSFRQLRPSPRLLDSKAATGEMASQWFHDPSHALQVLAVTGTNGKTSSTWWLAEA